MGVGLAAASVVLFSGTLLAAAGFVEHSFGAQEAATDAKHRAGYDGMRHAQASLQITGISTIALPPQTRVSVENTGPVTFNYGRVEVLWDGVEAKGTITTKTINGNALTNVWAPEHVLQMNRAGIGFSENVCVYVDTGAGDCF